MFVAQWFEIREQNFRLFYAYNTHLTVQHTERFENMLAFN